MKIEEEIRNILNDEFDSDEETISRLKKLFISKCAGIFDAGGELNKKPTEKLDWKYKHVGDYLKEHGIL